MAYFLFKLVRIYHSGRVDDYKYARKSLTTFAVMSILLLIMTIVYTLICAMKYGHGLKPLLNSPSSRWRRRKPGEEELTGLYPTNSAAQNGSPNQPPPRMEID